MVNYYNIVKGHLKAGDIAKAEDINQMQTNNQDAFCNAIVDFNENDSFILGQDEDAFLITPAPRLLGRYVDTYSLPEEQYYKKLPIRTYDYRQPIAKTKSSLYSIICKMGNTSSYPVTVWCELQDITGLVLRRSSIYLPSGTENAEFEVLFDLNHYPTAPGLDFDTLKDYDGKHIASRDNDESYEEGVDHTDEQSHDNSSIGVTQLYFVIKALNINEFDVAENGDEYIGIKDDDFYVIADVQGVYASENNGLYVEQNGGSGFIPTTYSLYFKDIYANDPTYICNGGEAVIGGEKIKCQDSHVTIAGGHEYGNVMSLVYMDMDGHLHANNSQASNSTSTNIEDYELEEELPSDYLLIAKVLTYLDYDSAPLIIQNDDEQTTLPSTRTRLRSHHERIRRLEKQMNYINDISIPPRIKYTITGEDWIDKDKDGNLTDSSLYANNNDADGNSNYITTTDADGNFVVKTTANTVIKAPVTLKDINTVSTTGVVKDTKTNNEVSEYSDNISSSDTKSRLATYQNDDTTKLNRVSEMSNMTLNTKKGILTLKGDKTSNNSAIGTTDKEAKETKFNPWDDDASNRVPRTNTDTSKKSTSKKGTVLDKPIEREYTVTKGKDGKNDWVSEFPAMTLFVSKSYKLTGLNIPIRKFKNCSAIKFFIYKRQGPNNKTNTVWLEKKIYTSKEFSITKSAKVKDGYQYIDDGFTMKFKNPLVLPKGQYVIIALPIPKSGTGSCFVETYKPSNSKDFCIRYYGAANASHFLLKTRYHEVWYNSASATGEVIDYEKQGSITSGTVTWSNGDPITSVKADLGNINVPSGCSFTLYADTGGGWQKVYTSSTTKKTTKTENKEVTMKGGGLSFKWKLEFKGNGEDTPTLKYDSKKKYAINFTITKKTANISSEAGKNYEKNISLTSIPFDGDNILREYIGDPNFDAGNDRFSNYEFARIWGNKDDNESLLIDISASDKNMTVSGKTFPVYSLHYCDLTLNDFSNTSVDYSNYDGQLEIDENNMRLKLDTEHSYNDNDIRLFDVDKFVGQTNDLMSFEKTTTETVNGEEVTKVEETKEMSFTPSSSGTTNQLLLKAKFDNSIDLTKYTGIKLGLKVSGTGSDSIRGLGVYFSSAYENDVPSNYTNDPEDLEELSDVNLLLSSFNTTDNDLVSKYEGKILKIYHDPENETQSATPSYYQYVRKFDIESDSVVYQLEQLHNIKSYTIYRLPTLTVDTNTIYKTIEIDQNNPNLQNVREIGILALLDTKELDDAKARWFTPPAHDIKVELVEFRSIEEDYYPVFNPANNDKLTVADSQWNGTGSGKKYAIYPHNKFHLNDTGNFSTNSDDITYLGANTNTKTIKGTNPITTQITIRPSQISANGEMICFFNNTQATKNYKHIGVQIASDCYIPKNSLQVNLCSEKNGVGVIESINIPTLNYVYYPNNYTPDTNKITTIPLSQVYKKIETMNTEIKSISISATNKFNSYMNGMFYDDSTSKWKRPMINIFIGKIVLYKAETIPIFHKKMRFKFYNTTKDGLKTDTQISREDISIRKIGAVLDYK